MIATVIYSGTDDRNRRGWRGFPQPGLPERYPAVLAAVGIGIVWTLRYAPLFYPVVFHQAGSGGTTRQWPCRRVWIDLSRADSARSPRPRDEQFMKSPGRDRYAHPTVAPRSVLSLVPATSPSGWNKQGLVMADIRRGPCLGDRSSGPPRRPPGGSAHQFPTTGNCLPDG